MIFYEFKQRCNLELLLHELETLMADVLLFLSSMQPCQFFYYVYFLISNIPSCASKVASNPTGKAALGLS
jgi:hypothetical protein